MNILDKIRPNIRTLKAYSSARDEFDGDGRIMLDANESPFESGLNRYPDPFQKELKEVIAANKGLDPQNLFIGNGSDEVLDLVIRAFCEPTEDNLIITPPTYGMYAVLSDINNVAYREASLNEDFSLNTPRILQKVDVNTKIIFLCSPNNPSGNLLIEKDIEFILQTFDGIVVIDEAYIEFSSSSSWSNRLSEYPQLIVIQTLSKSSGLAGIRLGMCWASEEIVDILNRIKPPYNVNELSQLAAIEKLNKQEENKRLIKVIQKEKKLLKSELEKLGFVEKIYPSDANFFLIKVDNASDLYQFLLTNGIVVRDRSNQVNCQNCLRITVGNPNEDRTLIEYLKNYKK